MTALSFRPLMSNTALFRTNYTSFSRSWDSFSNLFAHNNTFTSYFSRPYSISLFERPNYFSSFNYTRGTTLPFLSYTRPTVISSFNSAPQESLLANFNRLAYSKLLTRQRLYSPNTQSFGHYTVLSRAGNNSSQTLKFNTGNTKFFTPNLTLQNAGYNLELGKRLANIAEKNKVGFTGYCATYVKKDIDKAGLGNGPMGHGYMCADALRRNPNFKEISTNGLNLKQLPPGCVLVYGRGVAGYSKAYGHVEITDGKGSAISDGVTRNIRPGAKVFVPVQAA